MGLVAGESLADDLAVSPVGAMWAANWFVLAAASVVIWGTRRPLGPGGFGSLSIGRWRGPRPRRAQAADWEGPPERVAEDPAWYTGRYLAEVLRGAGAISGVPARRP